MSCAHHRRRSSPATAASASRLARARSRSARGETPRSRSALRDRRISLCSRAVAAGVGGRTTRLDGVKTSWWREVSRRSVCRSSSILVSTACAFSSRRTWAEVARGPAGLALRGWGDPLLVSVTGPTPLESVVRPAPTWTRATRGPTDARRPFDDALTRTPGAMRTLTPKPMSLRPIASGCGSRSPSPADHRLTGARDSQRTGRGAEGARVDAGDPGRRRRLGCRGRRRSGGAGVPGAGAAGTGCGTTLFLTTGGGACTWARAVTRGDAGGAVLVDVLVGGVDVAVEVDVVLSDVDGAALEVAALGVEISAAAAVGDGLASLWGAPGMVRRPLRRR